MRAEIRGGESKGGVGRTEQHREVHEWCRHHPDDEGIASNGHLLERALSALSSRHQQTTQVVGVRGYLLLRGGVGQPRLSV
jgi:hypothetical protein